MSGPDNDIRSPTDINKRLLNLTQGIMWHKPTSAIVLESTVKAPGDEASPIVTGWTASCHLMTALPIAVPPVEKKPPAPVEIDKDSSLAPKSPTYSISSDSTTTTPHQHRRIPAGRKPPCLVIPQRPHSDQAHTNLCFRTIDSADGKHPFHV